MAFQASGTLAFVVFSCLMLAANMGYLPLNPAQLKEDNYGLFNPFVLGDTGYGDGGHYTARSVQNEVKLYHG